MKSSKYEYRLVTAPEDGFVIQRRYLGICKFLGWTTINNYNMNTTGESVKAIKKLIARDNFIPEVVEI